MSRIISFDFGLKRIGVATGNDITKTAQALSTISAKDGDPDWRDLDLVLKEWKPALLVVGLPLSMDGNENPMTSAARKFGEKLTKHTGLSVTLVDERLSSLTADQLLMENIESGKKFKKKHNAARDNLAAQLILQTYFNS